MARITVEDCLTKENNRFALVQLAAKRTKQLLNGARVLLSDQRGNKAVVTALREIASGQVRFMSEEEKQAKEEERLRLAEEAAAARESRAIAMQTQTVVVETSAPAPADVGGNEGGESDGSSSSNGTSH
jgi:DNA-directed RNA polymerase subunit omega